jgi:phospholipid/cholesterol/gamma-HCH transport system ATP-binding protein
MSEPPAQEAPAPGTQGGEGAEGAPSPEEDLRKPDPRWQIRVRNLRKRFKPDQPEALRGVSVDFERGKVNVILGGSGQGKSVLLKHIIALVKPTSGKVWVDGVDIHSLGDAELATFRRKFGMVFQNAALFDSLTVEENCAFPLVEHTKMRKAEIHERVLLRLKDLGLEGAEKKFPPELSGGMRKRVGLVRALVLEPEIILYDEPTTGLDPIATENVDRMITGVAEKFHVTSIVISHDMASVFRIADRISMIHAGQVVCTGTVDEIKATDNEYVRRFIATSGVAAVAWATGPAHAELDAPGAA